VLSDDQAQMLAAAILPVAMVIAFVSVFPAFYHFMKAVHGAKRNWEAQLALVFIYGWFFDSTFTDEARYHRRKAVLYISIFVGSCLFAMAFGNQFLPEGPTSNQAIQ
jgi:hypothetical protein